MPTNTLVLIAVLALLVFWGVGAHNRLIRLRNGIASAFSPIEVQLKRRHELIADLVETAKKHLGHEQDLVEAVTAARNQAQAAAEALRRRPTSAQAVALLTNARQVLDGDLHHLFEAVRAYPGLRADIVIGGLSKEISDTYKKMNFALQAYNDAVRDYNHAQGQFPALLLATLFGFKPAAMLQTTEAP